MCKVIPECRGDETGYHRKYCPLDRPTTAQVTAQVEAPEYGSDALYWKQHRAAAECTCDGTQSLKVCPKCSQEHPSKKYVPAAAEWPDEQYRQAAIFVNDTPDLPVSRMPPEAERAMEEGEDMLAELVAKRTAANPNFPALVEKAKRSNRATAEAAYEAKSMQLRESYAKDEKACGCAGGIIEHKPCCRDLQPQTEKAAWVPKVGDTVWLDDQEVSGVIEDMGARFATVSYHTPAYIGGCEFEAVAIPSLMRFDPAPPKEIKVREYVAHDNNRKIWSDTRENGGGYWKPTGRSHTFPEDET